MKNVPSCVRVVLWSYDIGQMDKDRDRRTVIEQVLNFGRLSAVKWLFKNYSRRVIRHVVAHPSRGSWQPEVLSFWLLMFKMKPSPRAYYRALSIIDPIECQALWKKHKIFTLQGR